MDDGFPKHLPPLEPSPPEPASDAQAFVAVVPPLRQGEGDPVLAAARTVAGAAAVYARMTGRTAARVESVLQGPDEAEAVARVFAALHRLRVLRQKDAIVGYCPECRRVPSGKALDKVRRNRWTVKFPLAGDSARFLSVPTEAPETLFADVGVAIGSAHPRAADLEEKRLVLPLAGRELPVLRDADAFVGDRTAVRRVTPAHDAGALEIARTRDIETVLVFDEKGIAGPAAPAPFRGLDRKEMRLAAVAGLEKESLIESVEEIEETVPVCGTCRSPLGTTLVGQWRMRIGESGKRIAEWIRAGKIAVLPPHEAPNLARRFERLRSLVASEVGAVAEPGEPAAGATAGVHRVPAWRCGDCGEHTAAARLPSRCARCGGERLSRDRSILSADFVDVASAVARLGWSEAEEGPSRPAPADFLAVPPSRRQGWLDRFLIAGEALVGAPPALGIALFDPPLPGVEVPAAPPDPLRLALASSWSPGRRPPRLETALEGSTRTLEKLWNVARFARLHGAPAIPVEDAPAPAGFEERAVLAKLARAGERLNAACAGSRFDEAARLVTGWVRDLAAWLPLLAGRQGAELSVLGAVLDATTRFLAPFAPSVAAEVRMRLGLPSSRALLWPDAGRWADPALLESAGRIEAVASAVRRVRARLPRPARPAALLLSATSRPVADDLVSLSAPLSRRLGLENVSIGIDLPAPPGSVTEWAAEVLVHVVPDRPIDPGGESVVLARRRRRLEELLWAGRRRLMSPEFLEKAAPAVLERTRRAMRTRLGLFTAIDRMLGAGRG